MKKLLLLSLCTLAAATQAQTLTLTESASVEIPQDELTARFVIQQTGRAIPELTKNITLNLNKAYGLSTEGAKVVHKGISTTPVYDNRGQTKDYQVRAVVEVRSTDIPQVSKVASKLAEFMAVESLSYSVSDEARKAAQSKLNEKVAFAFTEKAKSMARALGHKDFKIQTLSLDGAIDQPKPHPGPMVMMAKTAMVADMQVDQAAGTERVTSTLNGTVALLP